MGSKWVISPLADSLPKFKNCILPNCTYLDKYNISQVNEDLFNTGTARQLLVSHEIRDLKKWWSTFDHGVETVDSLLLGGSVFSLLDAAPNLLLPLLLH